MNTKIIRYPLNEVEDRILRIEAEKACRRPEQHARWLLRQALGIASDQPSTDDQKSNAGRTRQDSLASAALSSIAP